MQLHAALTALLIAAPLPADPKPVPLPAGAVLRLGTDDSPSDANRGPPTAVVFADKAIYTGTKDDLCRWDAVTGKLTKRADGWAAFLAASPDGQRLVGATTRGETAMWTLPTLKKTFVYGGKQFQDPGRPIIMHAAPAVYYQRLADSVRPWRWDGDDPEMKSFHPRDAGLWRNGDGLDFAVTPDGRTAVIAGENQDGPRLVWWDFAAAKVTRAQRNGRPADIVPKRDPADAPAAPRAFLPGGREFVAESDYGFLLMRGDTGDRVRVLCPRWRLAVEQLTPPGAPANRSVPFAISPDGRLLAVGRDRGVLLIETVSGCIQWSFDPAGPVAALAFSPDGSRLVSVGGRRSSLVWDVYAADVRPADETQLRSETSTAHRAMAGLIRDPDTLIAVAKSVPAVMKIDAARIRRRLQELDSPRYAVREAAQAELAKLPVDVRPMIEAFLKTPGLSAEAVARGEKARDALPLAPPPEDGWRLSRILEAVEFLNTPAARREMARLAAGETGYPLTVEASESLQRMTRRADTK